MSYLALARKWRPRKFTDIVGQEHVVQALTNALNTQKMHHAYLFSGTRGIGKTTIGRILAKAFNCEGGMSAEPCGTCGTCKEVDEGRFVDLIEVDAASKTKVDDTRELLDNVQFSPTLGKYKIYLIDEVHMLSKHSFNALLKTLEEPPPHVRFFLATTDPKKLPVTVLSRCLQFNLKRISPKLILDRLSFICKEEKVEFEDQALAKLARAADGSLRDALSLLDQAIAFCGGALNDKDIITMLGTIDKKYVEKILNSLIDNDVSELMRVVDLIDQYFPDYENLLAEIAEILQRLAIIKHTGMDKNSEYLDYDLDGYVQKISPEDIQLLYQIAITSRRDINLAPSERVGFEMAMIRMLAFRPMHDQGIAKSTSKQNSNKPRKKEGIAKDNPKKSYQNKTKLDKPLAQKQNHDDLIWSDLINEIDLNGTTKILADNCAFIKKDNNKIYLSLDERSSSYNSKERQKVLSDCLSKYFGETIRIDINIGTPDNETPNQKNIRKEKEKLVAAQKNLETDPKIKEIEDLFGGATFDPDSVVPKD